LLSRFTDTDQALINHTAFIMTNTTLLHDRGFKPDTLSQQDIEALRERARLSRGDILTMTTLAGCGHPGGSMSSIDMYVTIYAAACVFPDQPHHPERDRIVISNGHTSPGVYAALGRTGFFDIQDAISGFRQTGSIFEGHVERTVPGVEWGTGNLGQGLSVGCGFALAAHLHNRQYHTYVFMGDGEQQKGQIAEARRFAAKYKLHNLTVIIDNNNLQISGHISDIMPQNIKENFLADGWQVLEIDGHDFQETYHALRAASLNKSAPVAIIARTIMGKGVSFMENKELYHGVALTRDQLAQALQELKLDNALDFYEKRRATGNIAHASEPPASAMGIVVTGEPAQYGKDDKLDNRSAFGTALKDLTRVNCERAESPPFAVFDCDLAGSVKTEGFKQICPRNFFQSGIQEHNTASIAGALSSEGVITFFADFGVFGTCETYNQHRLNDINNSNLKLVCTHLGLDVGEDGKTHQCIDYIGLFQNLFGFRVLIPADPNQTDHATRYMAKTHGNFLLGMGRSKTPVILAVDGTPLFGGAYQFKYGHVDVVREGDAAVIISCGVMLHRAVQAWEQLQKKGISVQILNVCCPLHIPAQALKDAAKKGVIITYEDHNVRTGLGSIVANGLMENHLTCRLRKLGITSYSLSGPPNELFKASGLAVDDLVRAVEEEMAKK
jgi:transketolase